MPCSICNVTPCVRALHAGLKDHLNVAPTSLTDAFARVKAILGPESSNMFEPQTICMILTDPRSPFVRDGINLLEIAQRLIDHVRSGAIEAETAEEDAAPHSDAAD